MTKKNPLLHQEPPDRPPAIQTLFDAVIKMECMWGLFASYYRKAVELHKGRGPLPNDWPEMAEVRRQKDEQILAWERERLREEGHDEDTFVTVHPTEWSELLTSLSTAYLGWCEAMHGAIEAVAPAMAARAEGVPLLSEQWFIDLRVELRRFAGPLHPLTMGEDGMGLVRSGCPPLPESLRDSLAKIESAVTVLMDVRRAPAPTLSAAAPVQIPDGWPIARALAWTLEPLEATAALVTDRVTDSGHHVLDAAAGEFRRLVGESRDRFVAFSSWVSRRHPDGIPADLRSLLGTFQGLGRLYPYGADGRVPTLAAARMAQGVRDAKRYLKGLEVNSTADGDGPKPTVDPSSGRYVAPPQWSVPAAVRWYLDAVEDLEQFIFNCPPLSTGERDFSHLSGEFDRLQQEVTVRVGLLEPWIQESMPGADGAALLKLVVKPNTLACLAARPMAGAAAPYRMTEAAAHAFRHAAAELKRRSGHAGVVPPRDAPRRPSAVIQPVTEVADGSIPPAEQRQREYHDDAVLPVSTLAELFGVNPGSLRKRLERWRRTARDQDWTEDANARSRQPKFLYRLGAVRGIIKELRASDKTSGERPANE